MEYTLEEIKEKYVEVNAMEEPMRTRKLTALMEILEKQHGTLQMYPTKEFLATEAVQLYQEIGNARVFEEE
ncbi:hypothetical protein [Listeria ivanovii]|uniref:Uncharacterized protein n=1 Tax=Listeria ivanovii subsp. londoniensis TaxID=202752 RepID=A0ABS1G8X5_LISIV|nr:hypothetical protein [Listeria ivanovii]AIS61003.1 hypothetical protein JL58_13940 [Listeria ivanovii subsp. londoniensis]AIS63825.1 hypothetical protein JL53_14395 [Listeria ivanovii subsp. londoniensis]MBK1963345.1 hypothetical protein [Listeria ivanovii subsp. londoniensis]MBK1967006.1 hypothetical protein [Listeria ivanovii subsp. londoniensis]MBK1985902.1 hypothetical protein [Listeria ivanovii subsp. londoniensis]